MRLNGRDESGMRVWLLAETREGGRGVRPSDSFQFRIRLTGDANESHLMQMFIFNL